MSPLAPTKPRLTPTYTSANFNLLVSLLLTGTFSIFRWSFYKSVSTCLNEVCPISNPKFLTILVFVHCFNGQRNPGTEQLKQHFLAVFVSIQILTRGGMSEQKPSSDVLQVLETRKWLSRTCFSFSLFSISLFSKKGFQNVMNIFSSSTSSPTSLL